MVEKKPIVRLELKREAIEEIGFRLKDIKKETSIYLVDLSVSNEILIVIVKYTQILALCQLQLRLHICEIHVLRKNRREG